MPHYEEKPFSLTTNVSPCESYRTFRGTGEGSGFTQGSWINHAVITMDRWEIDSKKKKSSWQPCRGGGGYLYFWDTAFFQRRRKKIPKKQCWLHVVHPKNQGQIKLGTVWGSLKNSYPPSFIVLFQLNRDKKTNLSSLLSFIIEPSPEGWRQSHLQRRLH